MHMTSRPAPTQFALFSAKQPRPAVPARDLFVIHFWGRIVRRSCGLFR